MTYARLLSAVVLATAIAVPLNGLHQDAASLQGADPPANGVWIDSLDLTGAPIRRPCGGRGAASPPPPLVFTLGGATYALGAASSALALLLALALARRWRGEELAV